MWQVIRLYWRGELPEPRSNATKAITGIVLYTIVLILGTAFVVTAVTNFFWPGYWVYFHRTRGIGSWLSENNFIGSISMLPAFALFSGMFARIPQRIVVRYSWTYAKVCKELDRTYAEYAHANSNIRQRWAKKKLRSLADAVLVFERFLAENNKRLPGLIFCQLCQGKDAAKAQFEETYALFLNFGLIPNTGYDPYFPQ